MTLREMDRRSFCAAVAAIALAPKAAQAQASGRRGDDFWWRNGLIVQADGDGGDTAQREGMYWFARGMYQRGADFPGNKDWIKLRSPASDEKLPEETLYRKKIHQFLVRDATGKLTGFRRHPTQNKHSDPTNASRDQVLPLIAAMSVWSDGDTLRQVHEFLFPLNQPGTLSWLNNDWMDMFRPYMQRAMDQAMNQKDEAFDKTQLDLAVESRLCCIQDANDVGDDLNLLILITLSEMPRQPKNYIAAIRKKFAENRPMNYGMYLDEYYKRHGRKVGVPEETMIKRIEDGMRAGWKPDCSTTVGAFRWYCRTEAGGSPALANFLEPIVNKYLGAPNPPPPEKRTFKLYESCAMPMVNNVPPQKLFCQRN